MPTAATQRRRSREGARKVTMKEGIRRVLTRSETPQSVTEISRRVLRMSGVHTHGRTPAATIASILATENLKREGEFVRVAPGKYTLRSKAPRRRRRSPGRELIAA